MHEYLLVILDKGAVPFCYYLNPWHHALAEPDLMPLPLLKSVIRHADKKRLSLNFIYGNHRLPKDYDQLIFATNHVKIIPLCLNDIYSDGVLVLDADESDSFRKLKDSFERNIILRVGRGDLSRVAALYEALQGKFKRLNIHLVGSEQFEERHLATYRAQLQTISGKLQEQYREQEEIEINVISDRILLKQMNNCDAGVRHLTVGCNGKVYICPGFYHNDENSAVGTFVEGQEPVIRNQRLLDIKRAPICSRCDVFHCKRCVYLNVNTTGEINTPSREQCLVTHTEREVSRQLLNTMRAMEPFDKIAPIPSLSYRDPFQLFLRSDRAAAEAAEAKIPETADSSDYLLQIYEMQKKILQRLGAD